MKKNGVIKLIFGSLLAFSVSFFTYLIPPLENLTHSVVLSVIIPYAVSCVLMVFTLNFSFEISKTEALYFVTLAACLQNFHNNCTLLLEILILNKFGSFNYLGLVVFVLEYGGLILFKIFDKKNRLSTISDNFLQQIGISAAALIMLNVVYPLSCAVFYYNTTIDDAIRLNGLLVIHIFAVMINILLAFFLFILTTVKKQESDIEIYKELLKDKENQYLLEKSVLDTISIKYHDIKHILNLYKDKIDETAFQELHDTVSKFSGFIKTGNDVIDTVLTQKGFICVKNNINFSCILNGENYSYLSPSEIYSLFGNALDNAIEASLSLKEEDRFISIVEKEFGEYSNIKITNNYEGNIHFDNGLPKTKKDRNLHGYGVRSIKLIAEKYDGRVFFVTEDNIFILDLFLKRNKAVQKTQLEDK